MATLPFTRARLVPLLSSPVHLPSVPWFPRAGGGAIPLPLSLSLSLALPDRLPEFSDSGSAKEKRRVELEDTKNV